MTPRIDDLAAGSPVRLPGVRAQALETGRNRLLATAALFAVAFLLIAGRLAWLSMPGALGERAMAGGETSAPAREAPVSRSGIVDRNGIMLATTLPTASLYADARKVPDHAEAVAELAAVLPDIDTQRLAADLASGRSFIWIKRNLTPRQQYEVNRLGIPGLSFERAERRVYPYGPLAAHLLGMTDIDGRGIAGLEQYFDEALRGGGAALDLSIDIRVQSALRDALTDAMTEFKAIGAGGVVLDVRTGEVLAMVSLPGFDPNEPGSSTEESRFNRMTKGVYEMGSTFKLFTAAMALDSGRTRMEDRFDATQPLRVARFTISDYHAQRRWLSVPEIIIHSSNIGAARMALEVGTAGQQDYLRRMGLLDTPVLELPEVGGPLVPGHWREINTMTISYGHGIAVTPLQLASAVGALVNGGVLRPATLMKQNSDSPVLGAPVISRETSRQVRQLMRMVVEEGTGRKAAVPGYRVGGKTGTAEKQMGRSYNTDALISSFVGAFPIDDPRFVILALVDEPKGNASTQGYATGGWVAAPVVARMVATLGALYAIAPEAEPETAPAPGKRALLVRATERRGLPEGSAGAAR